MSTIQIKVIGTNSDLPKVFTSTFDKYYYNRVNFNLNNLTSSDIRNIDKWKVYFKGKETNITQVPSLYLDLSGNQIKELPDALFNLKNISFLDLTSNQITEIPNAINNLKNLEFLMVPFNRLKTLPPIQANLNIKTKKHHLLLPKLKGIDLRGLLLPRGITVPKYYEPLLIFTIGAS